MLSVRLLSILLCVGVLTSAAGPAMAAEGGGCSVLEQELGTCAVSTNDEAVDVTGTKPVPGAPSSPGGHSPNTGTNPIADVDFTPPPPQPTHPFDNRCVEWSSLDECLRLTPKDAEPTEDGSTPATPAFTISDLASFAPAPAELVGEPDNLGVAGLPTNFTADATAHTRNGTLFGYAIAARFTPASFTFHYGDGETRTTDTGGDTWENLDLPQFAPTGTSHTYSERGTYTARADTTYTAEIDLGTGWFPTSGTLTIPGPTQDIRIYEARTALVAHTCTENPAGPGC